VPTEIALLPLAVCLNLNFLKLTANEKWLASFERQNYWVPADTQQ